MFDMLVPAHLDSLLIGTLRIGVVNFLLEDCPLCLLSSCQLPPSFLLSWLITF